MVFNMKFEGILFNNKNRIAYAHTDSLNVFVSVKFNSSQRLDFSLIIMP